MFNSKFYIGVVENRFDPEKLGRCQVRVFGIHSESKKSLPTEDLPWAIPLQPIHSASISGVGQSPLGVIEGSWVLVIFIDGNDLQQPLMIGTITTRTQEYFSNVAKISRQENKNLKIVVDEDENPIHDSDNNRVQFGKKYIEGWYLGKTSEGYESKGNAGAINPYNKVNDIGGASYGAYQLASYKPEIMPNGNRRPKVKVPPVMQFIRNSKYEERFAGLEPGTSAFDQVWKKIDSEESSKSNKKTENEFWKDQHDYIKRKYYDVCISNIQRHGIDLSKFGPGVQDLVWSTAVQLGPSNINCFIKPLRYKSQLTDRMIIELVMDYKIKNVASYFRSSSASVQASVENRWKREMNDLLALV